MLSSPIAKAIIGGIAAALAFAIPVVDDGVTISEILGILLAGIAGSGLVYITPNKPQPARSE